MEGPGIARIGALVGDPARALMLTALMDGRALTATELAHCAGVSPQTASAHLAKLTAGALLSLRRQGRHRYYQLASADVGRALESLMVVAGNGAKRITPGPRDTAMRSARTCYDHFAGKLGVDLADALKRLGYVADDASDFRLTESGRDGIVRLGIDVESLERSRRYFARSCLDWSERRPHVGGALGAALATRCFEMRWVMRVHGTRAVKVTPTGKRMLGKHLGMRFE